MIDNFLYSPLMGVGGVGLGEGAGAVGPWPPLPRIIYLRSNLCK